MKKTIEILTTSLLVLVVILAMLLVGVRLFGLAPYTVLSGSMEPNFHVGSLIYVCEAEPSELEVGDPITYTLENGTVVTHRIVEILGDPNSPSASYMVKGDANKDIDGTPVPYSRVIGEAVFHIPLLGYLSYYLHTPLGIVLAAAVIVLLIMMTFLPDLIKSLLEDEKKEEAAQEEKGESNTERLRREIEELREAVKEKNSPSESEPPEEGEH